MERDRSTQRRSDVHPDSAATAPVSMGKRVLLALVALVVAAGTVSIAATAGQTPVANNSSVTSEPTDQELPNLGVVQYANGVPYLNAPPVGRNGCTTKGEAPKNVANGGTFGRAKLGAEQVQTAASIISVAKTLKIDQRGVRIALLIALNDAKLNPFAKNGDRVGLFQQPAAGHLKYDRADAIGATRMFFADLKKSMPHYAKDPRPEWSIAGLLQKTNGLKYNGWRTTVDALVKKLYAGTPAYKFEPMPDHCPQDGEIASGVPGTFDPGMIIADEVFYNAKAMSLKQIRAFIGKVGASCSGEWCLKNLRLQVPTVPADEFCKKIPGGKDDAAEVIWKVSLACGVNPQVMLVTLQKESSLLDKTGVSADDYRAAWGWHCPDTGPGGTANCAPEHAGFYKQAVGMAKQWARYSVNPAKYNYQAGKTVKILYNVVESGCGGAEVTIRNKATAALYNYTPYQPNAAALAAYPGVGDACSTYGNRNFFFLFAHYFGNAGKTTAVALTGVEVKIPSGPYVPESVAGRTIKAPTPQMARAIAAGFEALGVPYVWGGGTNNGGMDEGCSRGGGSKNSCQGVVGFDCSGLTGYVLAKAGFRIPTNSAAQRSGGTDVGWKNALPGDIIGFDGHVAIYLGIFDGVPYMLEAPDVGKMVRIRDVTPGADSVVHRYWS